MSDFRFGVDDYRLDYHPHDGVHDEHDCIDWSKVERVEIDWEVFIREQTCEVVNSYCISEYRCYEYQLSCGHSMTLYSEKPMNYCPICGARMVS